MGFVYIKNSCINNEYVYWIPASAGMTFTVLSSQFSLLSCSK